MRPTLYNDIPMGKVTASRLNRNGPIYIIIAHGIYPYNEKYNIAIKENLGNYSIYNSQLHNDKNIRKVKYLGIKQLTQSTQKLWYKKNENVKKIVPIKSQNVTPDIILPPVMWDKLRLGALSDNGLSLLAKNPMSKGINEILNKLKSGKNIFHQRFPYYWSKELESYLKINSKDKKYYDYLNSFKDLIVFPNILFTTDKYAINKKQNYERFHSVIIRISGKSIDKSKSIISQLNFENLNSEELNKIKITLDTLGINHSTINNPFVDKVLTNDIAFLKDISDTLKVNGIHEDRVENIHNQLITQLRKYTVKQDIYDLKGSIENNKLTTFDPKLGITDNIENGICEKKHSHSGNHYFQTDLNSILLLCNVDFENNFRQYKNSRKYKMNIGISTCMDGMPSYLRDLMYADKEITSKGTVKKGRHKNVYIPRSVSVKKSVQT